MNLQLQKKKQQEELLFQIQQKKNLKKGKIVAAGNGKKDEPLTVKEGDTVLYGQYSGTEIKIEGSDYLIMRESDIFAIVK